MRKMNLFLCLVVAASVFSGCSKNSSTALDNSGSNNSGIITKETESKGIVSPTDIAMTDFSCLMVQKHII